MAEDHWKSRPEPRCFSLEEDWLGCILGLSVLLLIVAYHTCL